MFYGVIKLLRPPSLSLSSLTSLSPLPLFPLSSPSVPFAISDVDSRRLFPRQKGSTHVSLTAAAAAAAAVSEMAPRQEEFVCGLAPFHLAATAAAADAVEVS